MAAAASDSTPEEQIDGAYGVLHAALKAEVLQRVLAQTPSFFERVIVDLLVAMGYGGTHEQAALRLGKSGGRPASGSTSFLIFVIAVPHVRLLACSGHEVHT